MSPNLNVSFVIWNTKREVCSREILKSDKNTEELRWSEPFPTSSPGDCFQTHNAHRRRKYCTMAVTGNMPGFSPSWTGDL